MQPTILYVILTVVSSMVLAYWMRKFKKSSWMAVVCSVFIVSLLLAVTFFKLLGIFYSDPQKELSYHPTQQAYQPMDVALSVENVRQIFIEHLDPQSTLLPQLTKEEREQREQMAVAAYNKKGLDCLTMKDAAKDEGCQQLQAEAMAEIRSAPKAPEKKLFTFSVHSGADLVVSESRYQAMNFEYQLRNFPPDHSLAAYVQIPSTDRANDLWLSEDADMNTDNYIEYPSDWYYTLHLKKFHPTSEYTHNRKPVLGTSDYIIRLTAVEKNKTRIEVIPIFPHVLVGLRFESGCHAAYCPRWVYDLRPAPHFDEERIQLMHTLAAWLP